MRTREQTPRPPTGAVTPVNKILFRRGNLTATIVRKGTEERLAARGEDGHLRWVKVAVERVVFEGGEWGAHSLPTDDMERVRTHWAGYCETNGETGRDLAVGARVHFRRGMFDRYGKVLSIGPKRVRVAYVNKGNKARKECTIPLADIICVTA